MSILRNPLTSDYTKIPNALISDTQISAGAFRVACYLFSKKDGWKINNYDVKKSLDIKQNSTLAGYWKELLDCGWITRERIKDENGAVAGGYDYSLVLWKNHNTKNPELGKTHNTNNKTENLSKTEFEQGSPANAEQPPPPIAAEEKCTDVPPPPGFDEVWSRYGHKQQRADAIKAYKALKLQSDRDALLAGIPAYLAMLALPENSWRKQKLLGAFIRGRMWEDDFSQVQQVVAVDISDDNRRLMEFTHSEFPNVSKMKWLTDDQFLVFKNKGPEMFGSNYAVHASPVQLKAHIRAAFSEINSNSFKRSQYQDVYSYLCEDLKKRIYGK